MNLNFSFIKEFFVAYETNFTWRREGWARPTDFGRRAVGGNLKEKVRLADRFEASPL